MMPASDERTSSQPAAGGLELAFYGDDFTGSTDALEQLTLAGVRAALFVDVPPPDRLARFEGLGAVGVAGMTRSMAPARMEGVLGPAFRELAGLGARHVHYKVCSTFDSSPSTGSIGRVIDIAGAVFRAPFIPVLAAAPALGRYCAFGNLFARYGIGTGGEIHRLDRHPSISRHPITPMREADLRVHLAQQTKKRIALLDVLELSRAAAETRRALDDLLEEAPDAVLFDALDEGHLARIGSLLDELASVERPLFSIGSSGIEMALGAHWVATGRKRGAARADRGAGPAQQLLVGSGSCSPVTSGQTDWALAHGFAEVALDSDALASDPESSRPIESAVETAVRLLESGRSVVVHTTRDGPDAPVSERLKGDSSRVLGTALGRVLRAALARCPVNRLCIAGGDTSSYAARALGVEALEMAAALTPGAPLCRAHAPGSPADGRELVFKGGQVGAEDYFGLVLKGEGCAGNDSD